MNKSPEKPVLDVPMTEPTKDERDRKFWIMVRSALLMFVAAIEQRYGIEPKDKHR